MKDMRIGNTTKSFLNKGNQLKFRQITKGKYNNSVHVS